MCRRRGAWTRRPYKLWWCYFSLYWLCSQTLSISVVCSLIGTCLAPGCFRHSYLFQLSAAQGSRHGDKTGREKLEKKLKSKRGKKKRGGEKKKSRRFHTHVKQNVLKCDSHRKSDGEKKYCKNYAAVCQFCAPHQSATEPADIQSVHQCGVIRTDSGGILLWLVRVIGWSHKRQQFSPLQSNI